ncbi:MAG TPA: OsmC family protein [Steroidobacteraceae bacterium]|jgi:organic hydroperoxide reductase OsmC/OhrA|nr:OsmC family protein [Steroidobacteraceae bacterium]
MRAIVQSPALCTEVNLMSGHDYHAGIRWERAGAVFTDNRYSRGHSWHFDGGVVVPASSSPHTVRVPLSVEAAVDPEEALVAALASCHMLWFLSLAAGARWCVDDYGDDAVGSMGRNAAGKIAMLSVTLRPRVRFCGERVPGREEILQLHERAHEECFIANSVTTTVHIEPVFDA